MKSTKKRSNHKRKTYKRKQYDINDKKITRKQVENGLKINKINNGMNTKNEANNTNIKNLEFIINTTDDKETLLDVNNSIKMKESISEQIYSLLCEQEIKDTIILEKIIDKLFINECTIMIELSKPENINVKNQYYDFIVRRCRNMVVATGYCSPDSFKWVAEQYKEPISRAWDLAIPYEIVPTIKINESKTLLVKCLLTCIEKFRTSYRNVVNLYQCDFLVTLISSILHFINKTLESASISSGRQYSVKKELVAQEYDMNECINKSLESINFAFPFFSKTLINMLYYARQRIATCNNISDFYESFFLWERCYISGEIFKTTSQYLSYFMDVSYQYRIFLNDLYLCMEKLGIHSKQQDKYISEYHTSRCNIKVFEGEKDLELKTNVGKRRSLNPYIEMCLDEEGGSDNYEDLTDFIEP